MFGPNEIRKMFSNEITKINICIFPANTYLFKFNNRNTRKRCELGSKLTITTQDICIFPANIYQFKFNNKNTRKRCELGLKLTITKPERH